MKVCVIGGAGFIGSRVVSCLLRHGHAVTALVRDARKGEALARSGATIVTGDLRNPDDLQQALRGADAVVSATVPSYRGRVGMGRARAIARQHADNVRCVLDGAKRAGGLPVVVSEGTLMWGDSGDGWLDETSPLRPIGMGRAGELAVPLVRKRVAEERAPVVSIAPGAVYGAGSWFQAGVVELLRKGWYRTFGDGRNVMSFVHVDDVAEAYRLALEKLPLGEVFAVVDDNPARFVDFANCAARAMGRPPVGAMPKWVGTLLAGAAMAEMLTMNHRVRNAKAKEQLGWQPARASYEQGVPEAVAELDRARAAASPAA